METVSTDQELSFNIAYAMYYERLGSRFYGRLDKLASYLTLLCGMAVAAETFSPLLLGVLVASLTCWQVVYRPGDRASAARLQQCRYEKLLENFPELTEEQVRVRLSKLRRSDSELPGCLQDVAYAAAAAKLGAQTDFTPSWMTKLASAFCG